MITPALRLSLVSVSGALALAPLLSAQSIPAAATTTAPVATPPATPPPRKDADGRTLRRAPTGHLTNYYEDKVPAYTLPDPLTLASGEPVRDVATWVQRRRPELFKAYESEIFGRVPASAPKVRCEIAERDVPALDGKAKRSRIVAHYGDKADGPSANLMLYLPVDATGPVPLVLHVSFGGDPSLPPPTPPPGAPAAPPRRFSDMGPAADLIARGYGYAIVRYSEIQPDRPNTQKEGVIGLALAPGQEKPAPGEWGTIAAWSWGLARFLDFIETIPAVDAKRVAVVGHSRLGKTALWTGATDERFALIYSSQSGEMAAALSRRDFGESVDDMAANYGYQFAGNLQKYPGHWSDMPHEGHLLISLSAPRPVFISGADGDQWSDPHGQFLAVVAAGPVWRLFGKPDLGTTQRPALNTPIATGTLAFLENKGPHIISPLDWKTFMDFADRHLQAGPR